MKSKPSKSEIDGSAFKLMEFLKRNKTDRFFNFPFSGVYPKNCCESVSLIFTYLVIEKYGLANVSIIKGTKPEKYEHHFWVMVGDLHYDLTAHQFARCKPIIGVLKHPFFLTYPEIQVETERNFVECSEVITLYRNGFIPF